MTETLIGNDKINNGCVSIQETAKHHPYLPSYAWAAIAIGLFLMILTVCLFLKTKMFKVVSYCEYSCFKGPVPDQASVGAVAMKYEQGNMFCLM